MAATKELQAPTRHVAAGSVLAGLTLAWFSGVLLHLRTRMAAGSGDRAVFLWAWDAQPAALAQGSNPLATRHLFFPVGADLSVSTTAPLVGFLTWPVRILGGPALQLNVVQIGSTFLAAWFAYRLALRACDSTGPAVVAGAAFAFAPYRLVQMGGHLNLVNTFWVPLSLLALLDLLDRPGRRATALLGASVAGAFLTDPQIALLVLIAFTPVAAFRHADVRRVLRDVVIAAAVAVALSLPVLVPMLLGLRNGEADPAAGYDFPETYSTDLASWVVPPVTHPIWGSAARRVFDPAAVEGLAAPGLVLLGLALLGGAFGAAGRRPWTWMALVAGVLGLGPFLQILGRSTSSTDPRLFLPFALLRLVPGLGTFRAPGRISIVAVLAVDVLAAVALASLLRRRPAQARFILAGVALVTAVELLPGPVPVTSAAVPQPYQRIAASGDRRAVLEIPLQWSTGSTVVGDVAARRDDSIFLYYATVHDRPLVSGSSGRYSAERLERLTSNPLYRQVLSLQDDPGYADPPTFTGPGLAAAGIGFVVLHRDVPVPRAEAYVRALGLPVLADDGTVVVYQTPDARP